MGPGRVRSGAILATFRKSAKGWAARSCGGRVECGGPSRRSRMTTRNEQRRNAKQADRENFLRLIRKAFRLISVGKACGR